MEHRKKLLGVLLALISLAAIAVVWDCQVAVDNRQENKVRELLRLLKDEKSCFDSEGFPNRTVELGLWGGRITLDAAERIVDCERVCWLSTYGVLGDAAQRTLLTTFEFQPVLGTEIAHWHRKGRESKPPEPDPD
ncbi:MAG: hypothetical protein U0836_13420 [Pirellulales bacterium]